MTGANVDPNALDDQPHPAGTPAAETQQHPPVWDSHPRHRRWDWMPQDGHWVCEDPNEVPLVELGALDETCQPPYRYPPPHPRCRLGECPCQQEKAPR